MYGICIWICSCWRFGISIWGCSLRESFVYCTLCVGDTYKYIDRGLRADAVWLPRGSTQMCVDMWKTSSPFLIIQIYYIYCIAFAVWCSRSLVAHKRLPLLSFCLLNMLSQDQDNVPEEALRWLGGWGMACWSPQQRTRGPWCRFCPAFWPRSPMGRSVIWEMVPRLSARICKVSNNAHTYIYIYIISSPRRLFFTNIGGRGDLWLWPNHECFMFT